MMIIKEIKTERALSKTGIALADYVINPYSGCAFGCKYCYTRSNKTAAKIPHEWGDYVYVKSNISELLEIELSSNNDISNVLIGSITDPLQPLEKKYRLTKSILSILKEHAISSTILTRSTLIGEYLDFLRYSPANKIYFTYNPIIYKKLAPKYYFNKKNVLGLLRQITEKNIDLIIYVSPVFPYMIDVKNIFDDLKGIVSNIFFEGYNFKVGNWDKIKTCLNTDTIKRNEQLISDESVYSAFWEDFKRNALKCNEKYGFTIKFFIYPFNSYYPTYL